MELLLKCHWNIVQWLLAGAVPLGTIVFLSGSPDYPIFIAGGAIGAVALRALTALAVMMITTGRSEKLNPKEAIMMTSASATLFSIFATGGSYCGSGFLSPCLRFRDNHVRFLLCERCI